MEPIKPISFQIEAIRPLPTGKCWNTKGKPNQKNTKNQLKQSNQLVFKIRPFARYRPENAGKQIKHSPKKHSKNNQTNQTNPFPK